LNFHLRRQQFAYRVLKKLARPFFVRQPERVAGPREDVRAIFGKSQIFGVRQNLFEQFQPASSVFCAKTLTENSKISENKRNFRAGIRFSP